MGWHNPNGSAGKMVEYANIGRQVVKMLTEKNGQGFDAIVNCPICEGNCWHRPDCKILQLSERDFDTEETTDE